VDERRHPGALGTGQPLDPVAVRPDGDDLGAVRRVTAGIQQGLQVRPGARDEDDESAVQDDPPGTRWSVETLPSCL
jgi:hypothetical protein